MDAREGEADAAAGVGMPEDGSVFSGRAEVQRRIGADGVVRRVFVQRRSVRRGDRRGSRKREMVGEGLVRRAQQLAAAHGYSSPAQRASIAEREHAARYCDAADRVRLVERYEAGIDGE